MTTTTAPQMQNADIDGYIWILENRYDHATHGFVVNVYADKNSAYTDFVATARRGNYRIRRQGEILKMRGANFSNLTLRQYVVISLPTVDHDAERSASEPTDTTWIFEARAHGESSAEIIDVYTDENTGSTAFNTMLRDSSRTFTVTFPNGAYTTVLGGYEYSLTPHRHACVLVDPTTDPDELVRDYIAQNH
ncbi:MULTISPECIES: hypothetical protein [unclassified Nocardia]|uniref:hypothetical protein n=1 Tax=unclassified Nocardia TaxID=2637762 RepID=UPI001CE486B5|nr:MULTISPECIES: hypothetical protein [unclassified Nocardia]